MKHLIITLTLILEIIFQQAYAVDCGDKLYSNITLDRNLFCTNEQPALTIMADDVSIDLNGYILSGDGWGTGIDINGFDRFNIIGHRGVIYNFSSAIRIKDSSDGVVNKITFYSNRSGVSIATEFSPTNNIHISDNDFFDTFFEAIRLSNISSRRFKSRFHHIENNEFFQNEVGIYMCGVDDSEISGNLVWKNSGDGILLTQSSRNTIYYNRIEESDGTALFINNSSYNNIFSNRLNIGTNGLKVTVAEHYFLCSGGAAPANYSGLNQVKYNHVIGFDEGVILGKKSDTRRDTTFNNITWNKIYNNGIGILFTTSAYRNFARYNAYNGTTFQIVDNGTLNRY